MSKKTISPGGAIDGVAELPGDKSISHRYAILAALAEGPTEISNYASSADCASTLECLRRLGVVIETDERRVVIVGAGLGGLKKPRASRSTPKIPARPCACSPASSPASLSPPRSPATILCAAAPCAV